MTPLHCSAQNGHFDVCHLIIENFQEKNPKDYSGRTPLDLARNNNHIDLVNLISAYDHPEEIGNPAPKRRKIQET